MIAEQKSPEELRAEREAKEEKDRRDKEQAFLQKDYELRITYLTNHFSRLWQRFNYFLGIETALVGGKFLVGVGTSGQVLSLVGIIISVLWYVMGAEDRYLVRLYRHQVDSAGGALAGAIWTDKDMRKAYRSVGQINEDARTELREAESRDREGKPKSSWQRFFEFDWLTGWRWERISTTRLAALFPLLAILFWLIIFVTNPSLGGQSVLKMP